MKIYYEDVDASDIGKLPHGTEFHCVYSPFAEAGWRRVRYRVVDYFDDTTQKQVYGYQSIAVWKLNEDEIATYEAREGIPDL